MYKIIFIGNSPTSGKMKSIEVERGDTIKLPKNKFRRKGFKFVGWSLERNDKVYMKHFQLGKVKYKNGEEVKNLAKDGETIRLYACWKGYGAEAAALWAILIAKNNKFNYGTGKRSHHNGCYFCNTNVTGIKHAKPGSAWDYTYCCNPFVWAAWVHGANLFERCKNSGLSVKWWLKQKRKGRFIFKKVGRNVKYSTLEKGDCLVKNNRHIIMFVGQTSKGNYRLAQARREGWDKGSIAVTHPKNKRIGIQYVAIRFKGR